MRELTYNGKVVGIQECQPQLKKGFELVTTTDKEPAKPRRYLKSLQTELCYNEDTPHAVIDVLERCFLNRERIILDYGDLKTGRSWGEKNDIIGRVGRTTGAIKIPILVYNTRSYGGSAISTSSIIKITTTKNKRVLYKYQSRWVSASISGCNQLKRQVATGANAHKKY